MEFLNDIHFVNNLWMLAVPCVLMVIDFATGFLNAWARREVQSAKMRTGFAKKIGEIAALISAEICTEGMALPPAIMTGMSLYIVAMELVSITENLALIGVPAPKYWKDKLRQVHKYYVPDKDDGADIERSASDDREEK